MKELDSKVDALRAKKESLSKQQSPEKKADVQKKTMSIFNGNKRKSK